MTDLYARWLENYETAAESLAALQDVETVVSVFNANIDAVRKITPQLFQGLLDKVGSPYESGDPPNEIASPRDLLRGLVECFEEGIAQEWLITDQQTYGWLDENIGYDTLQMGGQGGIIGNVMAICGIRNVLVHAASLPDQQSSLFLDEENLLSACEEGKFRKACTIHRAADNPLIHWILEFNRGDTITVNGRRITCPKSNRFIATWDPLNFKLAIDPSFSRAMENFTGSLDYCMLSGYQMLSENLAGGGRALDRIRASKALVDSWRRGQERLVVHFEFASTQDVGVRRQLFEEMSNWADSMGLNEQELIDVLEVMGQDELAEACHESLGAESLCRGLRWVFAASGIPRIQLHFFGLYLTIQQKGFRHTPLQTRRGMALGATIAAAKACTGSIEKKENLLAAAGQPIGEVSVKELEALAGYLEAEFGPGDLRETGILETEEFDVIALPTIIIKNPVTLVGMGDTISSLSLVGAR
jgi:ADP-dependent phosphofructokinase/glucokinase